MEFYAWSFNAEMPQLQDRGAALPPDVRKASGFLHLNFSSNLVAQAEPVRPGRKEVRGCQPGRGKPFRTSGGEVARCQSMGYLFHAFDATLLSRRSATVRYKAKAGREARFTIY